MQINFQELLFRLKSIQGEMTTAEFARRIGVKQQTLDCYIRGLRKPSLELVVRVCSSFGVSADWLLGLPEHGVSISNSSNNAVNSDNASIQVDSPSCRDCPHLLRLIDILERQGGALSTANVSR